MFFLQAEFGDFQTFLKSQFSGNESFLSISPLHLPLLNKRQQKAIPSDVYLSSVRFKNQLGKSSVNQAYYREKHSQNYLS